MKEKRDESSEMQIKKKKKDNHYVSMKLLEGRATIGFIIIAVLPLMLLLAVTCTAPKSETFLEQSGDTATCQGTCTVPTLQNPALAEERKEGRRRSDKALSKRNWQVSNTINSDVLHHRQKRSEWVWPRPTRCCATPSASSSPPAAPLLSSPLPAVPQPAAESRQPRLCQQENPLAASSRRCQPTQSSLSLGRHAPAFARPRWSAGIPVIPSAPFLAPTTLFLCIHSCAAESLNGEPFPWLHLWLTPPKPTTFHNVTKKRVWPCVQLSRTALGFLPSAMTDRHSEQFFPLLLIKKWRHYPQPSVAVHTSENTTKVVRNS